MPRGVIALILWPCAVIIALTFAIIVVATAAPHAPFSLQLILPVASVVGTLALSYREARASGSSTTVACASVALTVVMTILIVGIIVVIAFNTLSFGDG